LLLLLAGIGMFRHRGIGDEVEDDIEKVVVVMPRRGPIKQEEDEDEEMNWCRVESVHG